MLWNGGEVFFCLFDDCIVIDGICCDDEYVVGCVVVCEIGVDLVWCEGLNCFWCVENGMVDCLVVEGGFGEVVEDDVVGCVIGCVDFLKDDVFFVF